MSHLQLSLTDYQDEARWRWVLGDGEGNFLADHEVQLDRNAKEYSGFAFLPDYLKYYRTPTVTQEALLEEVGQWMGQQVFGGLREALSDEMDYPATVVQVRVPSEAQALLFRPFELAYLDGEPFAQCGIRFVYQLADAKGGKKGKKGKQDDELRVLAVFSLPSQASPLNLRRERYGLAQLVDQLRQTRGAAVTLRVIQYGATRQTLKDALRQGDGWDVIHLSGHGLSGQLVLEDSEGKPDIIKADELAKLLRPTRRRVKLLTLSACLSGAGYNQARVMLGFSSEQERTGSVVDQSAQQTRLPSLAQELSQALGCAALAMRYPVGDSFATQLALELYGSLFNDQQSLPNALQIALSDALDAEYAQNTPLSPLTPILFGAQATDLTLTPPPAAGQHSVPTTGLLYFPPEPERFVGRVLPMLRASQALAPRSRYNGVLFYGMAGAGKTSCALVLAYRHEVGRFLGYVWFKAPDEGHEIHGTLANFLQSIENQLDLSERGILTAHLNDPQDFSQRTLPRLQGMLRRHATLIVIDNIESLLTKSGGWRDTKWEALGDALLTRTGASRLILTSRRQPTALAQRPKLLRLSIHALSLGESVLLARELDHLRPLFADQAIDLRRDRSMVFTL